MSVEEVEEKVMRMLSTVATALEGIFSLFLLPIALSLPLSLISPCIPLSLYYTHAVHTHSNKVTISN